MKHTTDSITIRMITLRETRTAGELLGCGMRDNPLHIRALGEAQAFREKALSGVFTAFMRIELSKGRVMGAYLNGRLVGVCGMLRPGLCQLSPPEKIKLLPTLLLSNGFGATVRMLKWFAIWTKHDLKEPHWHLGPIGIERDLQGQGIGSMLMRAFCEWMDTERSVAYLETDKSQNVEFYKRFGFRVITEDKVIDVPNWFMRREPKAAEFFSEFDLKQVA